MGEPQYSVKLSKLIDIHNLKPIYMPENADEIEIEINEVSRPGLQITGFFDYFDNKRVQILGWSEFAYLNSLPKEQLTECMDKFFDHKPVCMVLARSLEASEEMCAAAKRNGVPVLQTDLATSEFMSALINTLNVELAPRITRHGVLMEIYGEGVFILGESGVGKSETAIELVKRGHRLIADDAVEIRRVSTKTLVGSSPENIRHYMELRGIGIINVREIFGISAVKVTQQIDLVIHLEPWDTSKAYDRMGLETETTEILGNEVSFMTIPVKPGRNLSIILEVAAMNHRQRKMGMNPAKELLVNLGMLEPDAEGETKQVYDFW